MGNRSLRGIITKFILFEMFFTTVLVVGIFFILNISINMGFLYPANYPESLVSKFAESIKQRELNPDEIPSFYTYRLEDKEGNAIAQTIPENKNPQIQEAKQEGNIQSNSIIGSKIYVALEGQNQNLVLSYKIASDFQSTTLRKWLPNAEVVYFLVFLVFWVSGFVWIVQRLVKQLQREFDKVIRTNEEIGRFNLDYQPETSDIKEINQILTSIHTMKAELAHSLQKQWANQQQQERLVQSVTHDIRTPIAIVQGNLELMTEMDLSDDQRELLENAEKGVYRLSEYVLQLKEIGQLESKEERRKNITTSILTDWIALGQAITKTKKIQVIVDHQDESNLQINPGQLTQALQNIFQNTVDVSKTDTQIHFALIDSEKDYRISVSDNGPGFSSEALLKGKERFYTTKNTSGAGHFGLGLSIANELVKKNRGQMKMNNLVENGKIVGARVDFIFQKYPVENGGEKDAN